VTLAPTSRIRNASPLAAWLTGALLGASLLGAPLARAADAPDLGCEQEPGNRFFWTEWGFCDLPAHGPEKARGIVIWSHGISGTNEQYKAPPALVLRLLHGRGWDIIKLNRNNLGETSRDLSLARATERTEAEIAAQRTRGYRRIVLAGQSFGGYISLETAEGQRGLFGLLAMSPGVTARGGVDRIDPSITERLLRDSKASRVVAVFPRGDALFDHRVRGPGASRALGARGMPYLVVDETSEAINGHGGGMGGRFALRYGICLAEFLSGETPPAGRYACPEGREGAAARELLLRDGAPPRLFPAGAVPDNLAPFSGLWYGVLGETVVIAGLVQGANGAPQVLYRAAAGRASGDLYPARVEGGQLHATLGSGRGPTMVLTRGPARAVELAWTSMDGARTLRGTLAPLE
jgi:pimeloyl-ACP methyl ester carboxylesterase